MRVTVLGAGTMGHGIAQISAMGGHTVMLRDIDEERVTDGLNAIERNLDEGVERGKVSAETRVETLNHITGVTDLELALSCPDLVIEAIPEDMNLKQDTMSTVEEHVDRETLIATNTSSLSVTELMSTLERPGRGLGLHFFNPVHIMGLVEVIEADQTRASTRTTGIEFVESLEKEPIVVRDVPGFASSRLGVTIGVEAMRMVETGVATPSDIDEAMELGYNHPVGPLELTDIVGLDVRLDILEYLHNELGARFRPPQILKRKVRAGKLGKKTGEGFYRWEDGDAIGESTD